MYNIPVMEGFPQSPESARPLRYPEGWREILEAPDATDYQTWMDGLADMTQQACGGLTEVPDWTEDTEEVRYRWQRAIELVADAAIDPEDLPDLSEAEVIETALLTLQANIEGMGWDEEGLVFTVPNMFTGEEATIDLREPPGEIPNN
jgi:hypothetical protein